MTSAKPIPTPWASKKIAGVFDEALLLAGQKEIGILYCSDGMDEPTKFPGSANAALIVKAVNAHEELLAALRELRLVARVLLQNAEGCAVNHYGHDFELHGEPGWLKDARLAVERAETALAKLESDP